MPAHTGKLIIVFVKVLVSKMVPTVGMEQHIVSSSEVAQFYWHWSSATTKAAPNTTIGGDGQPTMAFVRLLAPLKHPSSSSGATTVYVT